jgi:hypothetical protein
LFFLSNAGTGDDNSQNSLEAVVKYAGKEVFEWCECSSKSQNEQVAVFAPLLLDSGSRSASFPFLDRIGRWDSLWYNIRPKGG